MEQLFKIMLAGDTSTGKTSFLTQLIYQVADRKPKPTDGLSFFALRLTNPDAIVQIWDSPGDPRFKYQVVTALQPFKAVLVFVDVTNDFTLHRARTFIQQLRSYGGLQIHIIESKSELTVKDKHKRKVRQEDLKELADSVGGKTFTYSRDEAIQPILQQIVNNKPGPRKISLPPQPSILPTSETNNSACECLIY